MQTIFLCAGWCIELRKINNMDATEDMHWQRVMKYCQRDTIWKLSDDRWSIYMEEHATFCIRELCIKLYQILPFHVFLSLSLSRFLFQMASKECSNLSTGKIKERNPCEMLPEMALVYEDNKLRMQAHLSIRLYLHKTHNYYPSASSSPSIQRYPYFRGYMRTITGEFSRTPLIH